MRTAANAAAAALVLAGLVTAVARAAGGPFAVIDAAQGELPKTVVPTSYTIDVAPNPTTMTIAGHEVIDVIVRKPSTTITLNALQTRFGRVTLDGKPATVSVNAKAQQATFRFAKPVTAGKHSLDIAYTATLQTAAQGLFKQGYEGPDGKPTYMYGTQLEATDARRLFPGWDEPAFRAVFHMSFVVPKAWTAVSNTPIASVKPVGANLKRVTFQPTPKMSSYLVVLCAGDFQHISTMSDGVKLSVYTTRGKIGEARYALHVMKQLMPYYDSYYGVHFPIKKLDTIAIPGGFLGAMENWGGITYNESTILYNPKLQPATAKKGIFDIIAHEESHQWNGDLTSFAWWDDVWLAEGFATWMQTKAPAHFHPEWHMYLSADNDVNGAMGADAQLTTHPIYKPVHNETQAAAVFDEISYTKAGAMLRMLEQYVGPKDFQAALQHFFRTHEYTAFNASDLWHDIGAKSHTDIAAITHNWVYEPGFPLVSVATSCANGKRTMTLTQQRYLNDIAAPTGSTVWSIPLNVQFDATKPATTPLLFNKATESFPAGACDAPLIVNGNDVGFYRTRYDAATQAAQQAAFLQLPVADRISLLNDAQSFAATGHAKIDDYLAYAKADTGDTDPHVVQTVLGQYGMMLAFERGKPGEAAAKQLIVERVKPMLVKFGGWDGTGMSDEQLNVRNTILGLLARSGDAETIAEAKARFAKLVSNPLAFSPMNRTAVIGVAGYAATPAIYGELFQMAIAAKNPQEQQQDFFALFGAQDPALAQRTLQSSLHLPPQFAPYAPFIVAAVGSSHPQMAWQFLQKNSDALFASMSAFERVAGVTGVASSFATHIAPSEILAYMKAHVPPQGAPQIKQAMDNISTQQAIEDRLLPQIDAYVSSQLAK